MTIKETAEKHWEWVESMDWHHTTPLEWLALIASEVGECVNECRGEKPTNKLGSELADIVLRVFDMAEELNINIEEEIQLKMSFNLLNGKKPGRIK